MTIKEGKPSSWQLYVDKCERDVQAQPAHTPTPWNIRPNTLKGSNTDYEIWSEVDHSLISLPIGGAYRSEEERKANAALIVTAVNERAGLLAVVEHILGMADDSYLSGHPEWAELVNEAKKVRG